MSYEVLNGHRRYIDNKDERLILKRLIIIYIIIIIMYIYHALINALSAHIIHINLNMIFL